mmetsp:Transcript_33797/g.49072  ORF Transcript_33797/g.49072 Transcript_33797/m.49072 type:complete len:647 (-) Transcript_33797:189-2129(-)
MVTPSSGPKAMDIFSLQSDPALLIYLIAISALIIVILIKFDRDFFLTAVVRYITNHADGFLKEHILEILRKDPKTLAAYFNDINERVLVLQDKVLILEDNRFESKKKSTRWQLLQAAFWVLYMIFSQWQIFKLNGSCFNSLSNVTSNLSAATKTSLWVENLHEGISLENSVENFLTVLKKVNDTQIDENSKLWNALEKVKGALNHLNLSCNTLKEDYEAMRFSLFHQKGTDSCITPNSSSRNLKSHRKFPIDNNTTAWPKHTVAEEEGEEEEDLDIINSEDPFAANTDDLESKLSPLQVGLSDELEELKKARQAQYPVREFYSRFCLYNSDLSVNCSCPCRGMLNRELPTDRLSQWRVQVQFEDNDDQIVLGIAQSTDHHFERGYGWHSNRKYGWFSPVSVTNRSWGSLWNHNDVGIFSYHPASRSLTLIKSGIDGEHKLNTIDGIKTDPSPYFIYWRVTINATLFVSDVSLTFNASQERKEMRQLLSKKHLISHGCCVVDGLSVMIHHSPNCSCFGAVNKLLSRNTSSQWRVDIISSDGTLTLGISDKSYGYSGGAVYGWRSRSSASGIYQEIIRANKPTNWVAKYYSGDICLFTFSPVDKLLTMRRLTVDGVDETYFINNIDSEKAFIHWNLTFGYGSLKFRIE